MIDRKKIKMISLSDRTDYLLDFNELQNQRIDTKLDPFQSSQIKALAQKIKIAKQKNKPVIFVYGAHLIKNGMAPVLTKIMNAGYITHLATNGAGSIHDLEFALVGKSSESVKENVDKGMFGAWEETGHIINSAILYFNAINKLGYGESVGEAIVKSGDIKFPDKENIINELKKAIENQEYNKAAAFSDLLTNYDTIIEKGLNFNYINKNNSIQHNARKKGISLTVHPGLGYDIIYTHPLCMPSAIGRAGEIDFLTYVESVKNLDDGGVYISIGSAIMSPMIFEKSLSIANNLRINNENKRKISNFDINVIDLQDSGGWNWANGEPPKDNPAYYLRFCKTFSRMGGNLNYFEMDNRIFLLTLLKELSE